jgi:hypothetical protein
VTLVNTISGIARIFEAFINKCHRKERIVQKHGARRRQTANYSMRMPWNITVLNKNMTGQIKYQNDLPCSKTNPI